MADTVRALPLGIPNARFLGDGDPGPMMEEAARATEREQAVLRAAGKSPAPLPPAYFLAVSGGGDNGAFGSGLLNGWTATGNRPEFKMVTGVSTGALIAPFAFLGPDYDPALREVYTTMTSSESLPEARAQRRRVRRRDGRHRAARRDHRRLRRQENVRRDRRRVPQGPASADRHNRPRRPASGDLEHRRHRGERTPAGAGAVPQDPARVGSHPRRFPARADRRRARR